MNMVIKLVKTTGGWFQREIDAIQQKGKTELETLPAKPNVAILKDDLPRTTIVDAICHSNFTLKKVDYQSRWS